MVPAHYCRLPVAQNRVMMDDIDRKTMNALMYIDYRCASKSCEVGRLLQHGERTAIDYCARCTHSFVHGQGRLPKHGAGDCCTRPVCSSMSHDVLRANGSSLLLILFSWHGFQYAGPCSSTYWEQVA